MMKGCISQKMLYKFEYIFLFCLLLYNVGLKRLNLTKVNNNTENAKEKIFIIGDRYEVYRVSFLLLNFLNDKVQMEGRSTDQPVLSSSTKYVTLQLLSNSKQNLSN